MLQLFKISGNSLFPHYKDGQRVLCRKVWKRTKIKVNDTVVFEKNTYGMMIKQVKAMTDKGYFVEGTDPMSIDSRNFGTIRQEEIKYKVIFKF